MDQTNELIERFLYLFGSDEKAKELAATGNLQLLWNYTFVRTHDISLPYIGAEEIVEACEKLDFKNLEKIYSMANAYLNTRKPLDVKSKIKFRKSMHPDESEDELLRYIDSVKKQKAEEDMYLKNLVEAFKSLNLQEIYARAKRETEVLNLCGDLGTLLYNPDHKVLK